MESNNTIEQHFANLIEQQDRTRADVADNNYAAFWMLLYHSLDRVREELPNALEVLDLPFTATDDFLREIVAFTFVHGQTHWAEMAVRWLEAGLPLNEQIAAAVEEMVEKKQGSQRSRHRAFRLVARWRKSRENAAT